MNPSIRSRYGRPQKLSDPHSEFSSVDLADVLKVPDDEMSLKEFSVILGPDLPAATYEEGVYFLPLAFRYILEDHKTNLDLVTPLFGFSSKNADQLQADDLLDDVRTAIEECFKHWMSKFYIFHFDSVACQKKNWGLEYFDYVKYTEVVCEGLCDLVRFGAFEDMALTIIEEHQKHSGDFVKAAWFLELVRARQDVYHPPRTVPIETILSSDEAIASAIRVVRNFESELQGNPTYWEGLFERVA